MASEGRKTPRNAPGSGVRALAAKINARVVADGSSLEAAFAAFPPPPERDIGLLRELCYGSLRWHHRLAHQAKRLLRRPWDPVDPPLASLMRIGLYQLQWLRIPDHAAVAATVSAAEALGNIRAKGFVNAVLRRFLRERENLAARLSGVREADTSHPDWMVGRLRADWPDDWERVVEQNNRPPPMWLRVNARRTTRAAYLDMLEAQDIAAQPAETLPSAVLLARPRPRDTLPGFGEGLVSVHDAGAQLAAQWLAPEPGQRVLDACAAPGGKCAHLLESCPDLGEMVALDLDLDRLAVAAGELERLGLSASLICGDAASPREWWDGRPFDRILLDAPCSALGVIRRHPDIKVLRRPADIAQAAARQRMLLEALWPLLAPGGRLLYVTCTMVHEENRDQIRNFLEVTPSARSDGAGSPSSRQILPGETNMDGFYYACIRKAG